MEKTCSTQQKTEVIAKAERQHWFRQQPMYARRLHDCIEVMNHWAGILFSESRSFDATRRALALEREFAIRKAVSEEKTKQAAQSVDQHQVNDVDGRMNAQEDGVITQYEPRAEGHSKSVE